MSRGRRAASANPTAAEPAPVPQRLRLGMLLERGGRGGLTFVDSNDVGVVEGGHDLNLSPDMDKVLFILDFVFPD